MLEAGVGTVVEGVLLGLAGVALIAVVTIVLQTWEAIAAQLVAILLVVGSYVGAERVRRRRRQRIMAAPASSGSHSAHEPQTQHEPEPEPVTVESSA